MKYKPEHSLLLFCALHNVQGTKKVKWKEQSWDFISSPQRCIIALQLPKKLSQIVDIMAEAWENTTWGPERGERGWVIPGTCGEKRENEGDRKKYTDWCLARMKAPALRTRDQNWRGRSGSSPGPFVIDKSVIPADIGAVMATDD